MKSFSRKLEKDGSRIPNTLVKKNAIVNARIAKIMTHGMLLEIPGDKFGIVHLTELADVYVDQPLQQFKQKINKFVKCQILSIDSNKDQIDLSLRASRLGNEDIGNSDGPFNRAVNSYDDLKEGDILHGYVKSATKVGVFVSLSPRITGRVLIKNLSRYFVKDYVTLFPIGKLVKAKILSIDPVTNNINLSLRGTDVNDKDPIPKPAKRKLSEEVSENEEIPEKKPRKVRDVDDNDNNSVREMKEAPNEESEDEESEHDNESSLNLEESRNQPALELSGGFDWFSGDKKTNKGSSESDESDTEDHEKGQTKKTKRQKRAAKKAEEEYLHKAELALLDGKPKTESVEDFDRLVLGSPDSSIVWIQYMAFHLHAAEIEKAIAVGKRALKTISFREEQEKLNVWVALLNLEISYGTKESLESLFQEAVRVNEPKKIFFKMVEIYEKNDKREEAEKMYQVMLKRFKTSKRVWCDYAWFLMSRGNAADARKLLQRCMKSLPERKHVATIVKFGMIEYKLGEPERGGTIFESLLKNYPKRTDLWSVYIDMNIKSGKVEQVRNIFERAIALNLGVKKMKFLFKRYIAFEEEYGDESTVNCAQEKAEHYLEQQMFEGE